MTLDAPREVFFRVNAALQGSGLIELKSWSDAWAPQRHRHCFNVTSQTAGITTTAAQVCSGTTGLARIIVKSDRASEGILHFEEVADAFSQGFSFDLKVRFYFPFRALIKKTRIVAGECIPITVTGGAQPIQYASSEARMGVFTPDGQFCADRNQSGITNITVSDAAGNKLTRAVSVRGPISQLSKNHRDWRILYGKGMPLLPSNEAEGGWSFQFPDIQAGHVSYLTQKVFPGYLRAHTLVARIRIETEGDVRFDYKTQSNNTCEYPAHVRFYLQKGAALSYNPLDRWWSNPIAIELREGSFELRVPVSPEQWSNTAGQAGNLSATTIKGFKTALENLDQIGFTFGGGCFFGHGVRTENGSARFVLEDIGIE